jgi:hypothetical protein
MTADVREELEDVRQGRGRDAVLLAGAGDEVACLVVAHRPGRRVDHGARDGRARRASDLLMAGGQNARAVDPDIGHVGRQPRRPVAPEPSGRNQHVDRLGPETAYAAFGRGCLPGEACVPAGRPAAPPPIVAGHA